MLTPTGMLQQDTLALLKMYDVNAGDFPDVARYRDIPSAYDSGDTHTNHSAGPAAPWQKAPRLQD